MVDPGALADATMQQVYGHDLVLGRPSRFGLGFQLTQPERPLGPGPSAFGHFGAGGSVGFCDPDTGIAFGYVTNQMGPRWQNPRNRALIDALGACLLPTVGNNPAPDHAPGHVASSSAHDDKNGGYFGGQLPAAYLIMSSRGYEHICHGWCPLWPGAVVAYQAC
jgi:CubicO group peptidase (beta-lactamase class C family)